MASGSIALTVAALDLQLVRLIRGAMHNADLAAGHCHGTSEINRRFHLQPETKIEDRRHIHPEPKIEARKVIQPADRFEPAAKCEPMPELECYRPCPKSPIEAPWKVLPFERRPAVRDVPKIKVVVRPPDIAHKGSLIDFFI